MPVHQSQKQVWTRLHRPPAGGGGREGRGRRHIWEAVGAGTGFHLRLERVTYVNPGVDLKPSDPHILCQGLGHASSGHTDSVAPSTLSKAACSHFQNSWGVKRHGKMALTPLDLTQGSLPGGPPSAAGSTPPALRRGRVRGAGNPGRGGSVCGSSESETVCREGPGSVEGSGQES